MKITDIKTYTIDAYRTNWTFIKLETDEGITGWGEASLGTQEGAVTGCVGDLKRLIVGEIPLRLRKCDLRSTEIYIGRAVPCSCRR